MSSLVGNDLITLLATLTDSVIPRTDTAPSSTVITGAILHEHGARRNVRHAKRVGADSDGRYEVHYLSFQTQR